MKDLVISKGIQVGIFDRIYQDYQLQACASGERNPMQLIYMGQFLSGIDILRRIGLHEEYMDYFAARKANEIDSPSQQ